MKKRFVVLLAAVVLVLSFTACTDTMEKEPVKPEVPPVTSPEEDNVLDDDLMPEDDAGTPDDMLPDGDVSDDDVLPENVLPEEDVLDDGTTNGDVTDDD